MSNYVTTSSSYTGSASSGVGGSSTTSVQRTADSYYSPNNGQSRQGTSYRTPEQQIEGNRETSLNGDNAPLVFPSDLGDEYYISFNAFKYTNDRPQESKRTFLPNKHIKLPLPTNLTDNYSSAYKAEDLFVVGNAVKEGMSSLVANGVVKGLESITPNTIGSAAAKGMDYLAKNKEKLLATGAVFALSGTGGQLASAAKSSLQLTTNPFPVMIFQGTGFKPAFTFDYIFYPESYEEAETIKSIIGLFRKNMLPEKMTGNESILKTPAIFEIQVTPSDILRKYKRCVLTNMGISYAPSGISFVKDPNKSPRANPTATSLSLTFQEIEVWLGDDYSSSELYNYGPE